MRRIIHYFIIFLILLTISSCGKKGKVIPAGRLTKIYSEMLLADQRIGESYDIKRMADTTLVYAPIIEKYGYSVTDYQTSVEYYISNPDKYARIFRKAIVELEKELIELEKAQKLIDLIKEKQIEILRFSPEKIFFLTGLDNPDLFREDSISFYVDSTGGVLYFDPQIGRDTIFRGPKRDIMVRIDTTLIDTLKIDSLKVDSLKIDSLKGDILNVNSLKIDSLKGDYLRVNYTKGDSLKAGLNKVKDTKRMILTKTDIYEKNSR